MTLPYRFVAAGAAFLFTSAFGFSNGDVSPNANPSRIDEETVFADWFPAQQSSADLDVFEINIGRTVAPERIREVRIWVDTVGLFRYDDGCEDDDVSACTDYITFEDIRRQELFKGQTKYPNTTAVDVPDTGEVFIFREMDSADEFSRFKSAMIDGKFKVRVSASSAFEFALKRVHVTVSYKPSRKR